MDGEKNFEDLTNKITIKDGVNSSTMIENIEVNEINYSMEKLIQAMAELPDEGIIDFGKVSRDLEDKSKLGNISTYLYHEDDESSN